jgi:hypothetical protein
VKHKLFPKGRRAVIVFIVEVLLVAAMLFVIIYGSAAAVEAICWIGGV